MKENVVAKVIIRNASTLTSFERQEVAKWLNEQSKYLLERSQDLSKMFIAKYIYHSK